MVVLSNENRQLFGQQVNDHIEKLTELLTQASGQVFDDQKAQKACLATRLLEGSTKMLGLSGWSRTLELFGQLIDGSVTRGRAWDENLSQIVSEVLETEEQAVAEILAGEIEEMDRHEQFCGLQREIETLLEEHQHVFENVTVPEKSPVFIEAAPTQVSTSTGFETLGRLFRSLSVIKDRLSGYIDHPDDADGAVRDLEHALGESEFFMGVIGDTLRRIREGERPFRSMVAIDAVLDGVRDFFNLHGRLRGWNATLEARAGDFSLEREAAVDLVAVLESCLYDTGRIHECRTDIGLRIELELVDKGSYLTARLSDNGTEFWCDSEIDRDDTVAYYQGLRAVRSVLERRGGLLCVEPEGGKAARFQFSIPSSSERMICSIVEASGRKLAIPVHCIDRVRKVEGGDTSVGAKGRYFREGGTRVPVFKLDELAAEEVEPCGEHDHLMIIGLVENRVGILVNGAGQRVEIISDQLTSGSWSSITRQFLHIGEEEYPVLDVRRVLDKIGYLQGLEGTQEGHISFAGEEGVDDEICEETVPRA